MELGEDNTSRLKKGKNSISNLILKAYVSQEILNWHSLRHSHIADF